MNSYLPPRPPPPPPPSIPICASPCPVQSHPSSSAIQISSQACHLHLPYLCKNIDTSECVMISLYNDVNPIIQVGPTCGLVALTMCAQMANKHNKQQYEMNQLLEFAKDKEMTTLGEMFSVSQMHSLAQQFFTLEAEIKRDLNEHLNELVSHLSHGQPILIPYDADANHEPALRNGRSAHWALISGFVLIVNKNECNHILESISHASRIDPINSELFHLMPSVDDKVDQLLQDTLMRIISDKKYGKVCVFARQGKSKNVHLWDLNVLCESNNNLVEMTRKYDLIDKYPHQSIQIGLNNQCLFIKSNQKHDHDSK